MPYLPVDLDAKRKMGLVARAVGVSPGEVLWGLLELWEHVWRTKADVVTTLYLSGCLGPRMDLHAALVDAGFLERVGDAYRVKGASKWLFGAEGTSRGGHAAKGNLIPGARQKKAAEEALGSPSTAEGTLSAPLGSLSAPSRLSREPPLGSLSALSASSQQPTTPTSKEEEAPAAPAAPSEVEQLQGLWNETAHPDLPRWRETPKKRREAAKARLRERPLPEWRAVLERVSASPFLRGHNDRGWRADPDWLLKPDSSTRVLEGKYDPPPGHVAAEPPPAPEPERPPGCTAEAWDRWRACLDGWREAGKVHALEWLGQLQPVACGAKFLRVRAPNDEVGRWVRHHFSALLAAADVLLVADGEGVAA